MNASVYWTDEYAPGAGFDITPDIPEKIDVAIIGGGYTGLAASRVLVKHGISVAILEEHNVGWGASSRNGGMATPGLKQDIYKIYKKYECINFLFISRIICVFYMLTN